MSSDNPLTPSKLNSILLAIVIAQTGGILALGVWGLQEIVALRQQVAGMTVQIQNLERIAYKDHGSRE